MKKIVLAVLMIAAVPAFAGNAYVVGSVGQSSADIDKGRLDGALTLAGVTGLGSSVNKTDTAYKLQVGYQFNQNFAVEGGYVDLGKAKYSASFTGGNLSTEYKASGLNVAAIGILPVTDAFSVFGKLGVMNAKVDASAGGIALGNSASATKISPNWGLGVSYDVNKQFAIRAEFEQFSKVGDASKIGQEADVNLLSAGAVWKF